MKKITVIAALLIGAFACTKEPESAVSTCIQDELRIFDENLACTNAIVLRYDFMGNNVYTFDRGDCSYVDSITVYDEECNIMGYLGGYLGNSTISGVDFYQEADLKATVWSKQ